LLIFIGDFNVLLRLFKVWKGTQMNTRGGGWMMAAWFGALLWSGACGAAEGVGKVTVNDAGDYLLSFDGQVVAIPFYKVDGVLLNDRCLRSPECLALQKLNGPHPPVELTISQFGTPASAYWEEGRL
jgi:hypothetical protein